MLIIHNPYVRESRDFLEGNPSVPFVIWNDQTCAQYPSVSTFPSAVVRGKIISGFKTIGDILDQSPPNANGFYHALQDSAEYAAIVKLATTKPAIQTLLMISITATLEAKAYQDSGKSDVDMSNVKARLEALIAALPDTVDEFSKQAIITKINEVATAHYVGFLLE